MIRNVDDLLGPSNIKDEGQEELGQDMKLRKAVDLMSAGSLLMQMNKSGDKIAWYLVPGGEVPESIAEDLKKMKNINPNNDGLFPGISQTWKLIT